MYDFVDRPVTDLDSAGRFLIWSMRSWVATIGNAACPASAIAPAFARWKALDGLQPFHRTMLLINRDALETFRFCALECNHVSEHEAILLGLVRSAAIDQPPAIRETLTLIVEEDGVGDLLRNLCDLARALCSANLLPGASTSPGS